MTESRIARSAVILLTGQPSSGKTTVCEVVVQRAQARGLTVGGIITRNVTGQSDELAQYVTDIATGKRQRLARATPEREPARGRCGRPDQAFGPEEFAARWGFDEGGIAFGNAALLATLADPPDLLVVDQIGPLELWCDGGFTAIFDVVRCGQQAVSLIAVNPRTLDEAKDRMPEPHRVLMVGRETRATLPDVVLGQVAAVRRG